MLQNMLQRKFFSVTVSFFLLVNSALGAPKTTQDVITQDTQVLVLKQNRVRNKTGIQCVWASLECLARVHGIEKASHLTDRYKHTAGPGDVQMALRGIGVDYRMNMPGRKDKKFLETCCENGWGACVGLRGAHMVNVVHFKDGVVKIIDNLDPELRVQEWSEQRFLQTWDGWAVSLVPPGKWVY